ncbi:hypothetical protein B0A55_10373 [Friedmanniomyces simplex]|uniref:Uncharacterized protein n=1 Tax=Friedmanniomyces simplex TaxID=329884 RepID=A0A4U0WRU5_9PEZI|nr:hypothetical protein B0A55_10373 [Friedmanniomyces simplex]
MGGSAFAVASAPGEPTLNTPRLTQEDYTRLKASLKSSLLVFFGVDIKLDTLSEAPEKEDHGDIDFLIAHDGPVNWLALATSVGATGLICHHPGMCSLAVPKSGPPSTRPPVLYTSIKAQQLKFLPTTTPTTEEYAQIDIQNVPTALYPWRTFYYSYGDIPSLFGLILRPLGFKISENGLCLRLRELEQTKSMPYLGIADHDGLLFLSCEPERVMEFLGLSAERYGQGFATLEGLYVWLGQCRGLCAGTVRTGRRENASQRAKGKRTVFVRFLEEWVPANLPPTPADDDSDARAAEEGERDVSLIKQRQEVLAEALTFFNKQADYDVMHQALVCAMSNASAAHLLRPIIALHSGREDKQVTEILRAFRRFVGVRVSESTDGRLEMHVLETPHTDVESELWRLVRVVGKDGERELSDWGLVSEFVRERWEEIRRSERKRVGREKPGGAPPHKGAGPTNPG